MRSIVIVIVAALLTAPVFAQEIKDPPIRPANEKPVAVKAIHVQETAKPAAPLPEKAPELSQAQQDQFTIAVLAKENAEKALRLASLDYQKAGETFEKVVAALQVPGYTLQQNRETGKLERVKTPEPAKKDPPK